MEERSLLKFKTTVPFPLLIYKVNVKYNEVRKASGVAYILLDLIDKTAGSEEKNWRCFAEIRYSAGSALYFRAGNCESHRYGNFIVKV